MSGAGDPPSGGIRRRHSAPRDDDELSPATRSAIETANAPYTIEPPQSPINATPAARTSTVEDASRPSISRLSSDASPRVRFSTDVERQGAGEYTGGGKTRADNVGNIQHGKGSGSGKRPGTPDLTVN